METIRKHFVCVAIDGRSQGGDNPDARFLREVCRLKFSGAGGDRVCITASGKVLSKHFHNCVRDSLKVWAALPESERKPGAVDVGKREATEEDGLPKPPPGGLVVKVYLRALGRDDDGKLRHAIPKDFLGDGNLLARYQQVRPGYKESDYNLRLIADRFKNSKRIYEPHPDYLWLTEAEWKSLVPSEPKVGDDFPVPEGIMRRLFQYHLDLNRTVGDPITQQIHAGKLVLKVDKVSAETILLKLSGFAKVSDKLNHKNRRWFDARLYGFVEYDRKKEALSRFDLLALGDTYGPFEAGLGHFWHSRPGRSPYGIAFELVGDDASPAERCVPPRGGGPRFNYKNYFGTSK